MTKSTFSKWLMILALATGVAEAREYQRPKSVQPSDIYERWHQEILTTVFWVGEPSVGQGWSANHDSAWDMRWVENYGGTDHPHRRNGYRPAAFKPRQNPFYVALPFNDLATSARSHPMVSRFLSFWKETGNQPKTIKSVCKNRWIAISYKGKTCFAQWQDVGPVHRDDYAYVFGFQTPKSHAIGMAGLDVSPAVRDYLGLCGRSKTNWRFIQAGELPEGPWTDIVTQN